MLFGGLIAAALLLVRVGHAARISSSRVLHEKRAIVPSEWTKKSKAPRELKLPLRIELSPQNAELGHDNLIAISDPTSLDFGNHWTPARGHDFFSPSKEVMTAVQEWLASPGISTARHRISSSRSHVKFEASLDEIESLLKTNYSVWEHKTGSVSVSCDEYHVPQTIKHHIDFIRPKIGLGAFRTPISRTQQKRQNRFQPLIYPAPEAPNDFQSSTNLSTCSQYVSPACIQALYGVPAPTKEVKGNDMGIFELDDIYDQEDLNGFFSRFAPSVPNGTHPILQAIDGGTAPVASTSQSGSESLLDLDIAYPLLYPQSIKLFQTLDPKTAEYTEGIFDPFLDALDASYCTYDGGDDSNYDPTFPNAGYNGTRECGIYKPPNVVSLSYEIAEAEYSAAYEIRQCHEYLKLGLMGTSIIFASGDNGTLSRTGIYGCLEDGKQNPGSPSTCPYVTSVGATQLPPNSPITTPEVAVNPLNNVISDSPIFHPLGFQYYQQFSSGGGFSNIFPRPAYQEAAVSSYLTLSPLNTSTPLPSSSTYNATNRAFPDVSAIGYNILTYVYGGPNIQAGTSASAPIFASIINRLNGERISVGKKPVGFLNPVLYANPGMFRDVIEGYNLGCNSTPAFYASRGWDPVTGLGTPDYAKMREVFMGLP